MARAAWEICEMPSMCARGVFNHRHLSAIGALEAVKSSMMCNGGSSNLCNSALQHLNIDKEMKAHKQCCIKQVCGKIRPIVAEAIKHLSNNEIRRR